MLERMGWSEGRGLGSKEDGKSEHVRVAKKSDTLGEQVPGCEWPSLYCVCTSFMCSCVRTRSGCSARPR